MPRAIVPMTFPLVSIVISVFSPDEHAMPILISTAELYYQTSNQTLLSVRVQDRLPVVLLLPARNSRGTNHRIVLAAGLLVIMTH